MWLTTWMLSFIPDNFFIWVSYGLMGLGISLYILSKIIKWFPIISQYKLPTEIVAVLLSIVSAYIFGSYGTEMVWRERVKELEEKVAISERKAEQKNIEIRTKIVEKIKEIKVVQEVVKNVIIEKERIIDNQCKVASEAVEILNLAATGKSKEGAK